MKRIFALAAILAISAAALYLAEHRGGRDAVSPDAVLNAAADFEREASRAPMQLTRLSDAEEIRIGDQLARQYLAGLPEPTMRTKAIENTIAAVGSRLAAHAHRRLPFRFHFIPDPDFINAFAIPGGHVFVGEGILLQLKSEDALAFLLGHEMEHIDHYHPIERVQIDASLRHLDLDLVAELASIPLSLWQAGYSKEQEFEADREGLRLAAASGYSARGAIDLLERFLTMSREVANSAQTPVEELSQVAIDGLQGYFRTHPETSERLAQVREIVGREHLDKGSQLLPLNLNGTSP